MKIRTPRQFSFFASSVTALFSILILILTRSFEGYPIEPLWYVMAFLIGWAVEFAVVYILLEQLISHRIRLLFRTIHQFKINKGNYPIHMNEDVLEQSEKEVMSWAKDKRDEIQRLKDQEEFRREFIGNLAHELKTPIFTIQGYILTLLEGGLDDPKISRTFLKRAAKGVDRMTSIINDLDSITKMESEALKLNIEKINIAALAREMMDSFEISAKEKNVKLAFDSHNPFTDELYVLCDQDKISQVFTNLINNSIKYGRQDGTGEILIRFFDIDENILIEVADNGPGIDKEHLPRLFERFYRVDKSRSRDAGGTGLGLAIVKHIVEAHGQTINVRSTKGTGSTFSFTLKKAK